MGLVRKIARSNHCVPNSIQSFDQQPPLGVQHSRDTITLFLVLIVVQWLIWQLIVEIISFRPHICLYMARFADLVAPLLWARTGSLGCGQC